MWRRTFLFALTAFVLAALALPAFAQAPDRTRPPQPGPAPAFEPPSVRKLLLSNGLPVWLVEQHEVPVAQVTLVVHSGAAMDPSGKFGLASLTAAMLDEGAGARSALEIADAVDYLGASLTTSSSYDASAVRLWVPVTRLPEALPIMADVALRPSFPAEELERLRRERLTTLLQWRDDPAWIGRLAFPRFVYGEAHRYGTPEIGTPAALRDFSTADLRGFYEGHYRPDNSALIVVGDVKVDAILPLLESAFGGWKTAGKPVQTPRLQAASQPKTRQVFLIDRPGAPQSQVRIGWVGVERTTPDYFVLQVMNTILGGAFTSRLNQNLREQHGYTYGASSIFEMRRSAGPFHAGAGVQTDKTAEAVREFFNELEGMSELVPEDELQRAKNYVALGLPGSFETTGDIARRLEEMVVHGLEDGYFRGFVSRIQSVTSAEVHQAARKYIRPDRFVVVVVGDRKTVEPALRKLNLGRFEVITVEQALGPAVTGETQ
jgi:zinc protease